MYKRILVATGGSPWSDAAVAYATALAAHMGAELRILTVLIMHAAYAMPDMVASSELVMESVERQGQELLEQAATQAASAGVACTTVCKWGNVPETILQTAAEEQCDLITLGSRRVSGRKRLWLGSIAGTVAAKAQQPVLVVKQPPPPGGPASLLWRRVLVATGGSPWSDAAVDYTLTLAQAQQLEVCLLHVDTKRRRPTDDVGTATAEEKGILTLAEARAAATCVPYEAKLAYGDVTETILETATSRECDVIILGSRGLTGWKRLMLGSISNAVAVKATLPVLIVKRFLLA
jgi:nucleotide-binding universal stress UspA family protein